MSNSHRFPVRLAFYLYIVRKIFHDSVSASALQTKCHSTMADSPSPPPTRCLSRLASSLTPPLALSSLPLAAPLTGPSSSSHRPPAEPLLRPSRGSRCTPHSPPWATPPPWTPSRGAWCSRMSTLPTFLPHPAHFSNLSVHFSRLYMRREQREISVRSDRQSQNGTSIPLVNFRNRFIGAQIALLVPDLFLFRPCPTIHLSQSWCRRSSRISAYSSFTSDLNMHCSNLVRWYYLLYLIVTVSERCLLLICSYSCADAF